MVLGAGGAAVGGLGAPVAMLATDYRRVLDGWRRVVRAVVPGKLLPVHGTALWADKLVEYATEPLLKPPRWSIRPGALDQAVRRERAQLQRTRAQFGALSLPAAAEAEAVACYEQRKGQLLEQMASSSDGWMNSRRSAKRHHALT